MGTALSFGVYLESPGACPNCGIHFAMPANMLRVKREEGGSFYCPNGHSQSYTKTEVVKLREELEAQKRRTQFAHQARVRAERELIAQKGQTTKARNKLERVGNGVCPCCNRSFTNLRRHMNTKHPEMKTDAAR